MIIPMTQDADGVWQYDDQNENDMVFELEEISGRELTSYDVLLNDVAQWAGHEKAHAHLGMSHIFSLLAQPALLRRRHHGGFEKDH